MVERPTVPGRLAAAVDRSTAGGVEAFAIPAAFLVALVAGLVPLLAVGSGLPVVVLAIAAIGTYVGAILAMGVAFEGLCAALFVTTAFNVAATVPVPGLGGQAVSVVELLAVAVLVVLLAGDGRALLASFDRTRRLLLGAAAAFALWAVASGIVANGPAPSQALTFGLRQSRQCLLLVCTALLVRRTDPRTAVYPLVLGLAGALVFALDEAVSGAAGYLRFRPLGPTIQGLWPSPSLTAVPFDGSFLFEGGVLGQSRIAVGLAVVFLPLAVLVVTRHRRRIGLVPLALLAIIPVFASTSDAGVIALFAGIGCVGAFLLRERLRRDGFERAKRLVVPVSLCLGAVLALWATVVAVSGGGHLLFVQTNNVAVRLTQFRTAIEFALQYPLFGIGGGTNFDALTGKWVHNVFLATLAATGIPGGLAYAATVCTTAWLGVTHLWRRPASERWLWVGVCTAIGGYLVYAFWTVAFRWHALNAVVWVLMGVVIGTPSVRDRVGDAWPGSNP
jgi:hypothetical protein